MKSNNNGDGSSASSSSNGSCASCRHQRKKCGRNCVLAPHFPASKKADFDLVLKHFGVKNLVRRMKEEPDMEARKNIIRSMVWDAKAREDDPEFGSYGLNQALLKRVEMLETYVMRGTYRWCNDMNLQMHQNNNLRGAEPGGAG
ncbi:LOB domain-containing protein 7 [Acorus calamus]|uniref:LOB domain-containing protein 7 n=1 Tax=Acorus calamus TaxID=4465 RepID=A0AAV9FM93_ACOCL|nr:LOB domain-containing protein 7 [Acorus calamus]